MDTALVAILAVASSTSAIAGAFVGAQFDRVYTGALVALLLGPLGVLNTLCAATSHAMGAPRKAANACFVLGPVGLLYAWINAPAPKP